MLAPGEGYQPMADPLELPVACSRVIGVATRLYVTCLERPGMTLSIEATSRSATSPFRDR